MAEIDWRALPSLSALRALEATARLDGFSAAARALNVTPAAVAQQVRGLEADLGVDLVRRDGRGLALTVDGKHLATALTEGFGSIAAGVERTRARQAHRPVRVATTAGFAQAILMPALQRFWSDHPDIQVSLDVGPGVKDVAAGSCDLAIRTNLSGRIWPKTHSETLISSRYVMIAAPTLAQSVKTSNDLKSVPWILYPDDPTETGWLSQMGLKRSELRVTEVRSTSLALASAIKGYGVTFAVEAIIGNELATGQFVTLPAPNLPDVSYSLVIPLDPLRASVQTFVDWLRQDAGITGHIV